MSQPSALFQDSFVWPYEEVKVEITAQKISLTAPWANAIAEAELTNSVAEKALEVLQNGVKSAADLRLVQRVLKPFEHLPFFYFLPRAHLTRDANLLADAHPDLPEKAKWMTTEALALCTNAEGIVDPISLLSWLRRKHLVDLISLQEPTALSKLFDSEVGAHRKEAVVYAIQQNWYVTMRCQDVLLPAVDLHPQTAGKIENFADAEKGHDLLMAASLRALGTNPCVKQVSSELIKLMNHFGEVANKNIVAFCFMVDIFERTSPEKSSSLTRELERLGYHEAAKPLLKHLNINCDENHDSEAFEFLSGVGGLTPGYATQAVALSAEASRLAIAQLIARYRNVERIMHPSALAHLEVNQLGGVTIGN